MLNFSLESPKYKIQDTIILYRRLEIASHLNNAIQDSRQLTPGRGGAINFHFGVRPKGQTEGLVNGPLPNLEPK